MASKRGRIPIALACEVCGARNYRTTTVRRETGKSLTLKKFCKACNTHTTHKESK